MNIQNISRLADQLQVLGFGNMEYSLAKRICFKPSSFVITKSIDEGSDKVAFQLHFERNKEEEIYKLLYYDATMQKQTSLSETIVSDVDVASLQKLMAEIDWKRAFQFDKNFDAASGKAFEVEQKIEGIVDMLLALEKTDKGKVVATHLKQNFWSGADCHQLFENGSVTRGRSDVSQRFYVLEGQSAISVDEAYRFLQNRWMEKELQAKRKQGESGPEVEEGDGAGINSNSKKKRTRKLKSNKI